MTVTPLASVGLNTHVANPTLANGRPTESEQHLIRELYSAVRCLVIHYGSQNAAARALGISSATLTRASDGWMKKHAAQNRLPRPRRATLLTLARYSDERICDLAALLLQRRGLCHADPTTLEAPPQPTGLPRREAPARRDDQRIRLVPD
jgi:hypothetical protein